MNKSLLGSTKTIFQNVDFGPKAHKEILAGAEILYRAVKSTMGPSGHNVIIENGYSAPLITKDGVTVAKSINLREKLPAVGAELLKEIAAKTNEMTGDGPQPLYSNVLTPKGWVKMGDLKIGDEICGTNKTKQRVLGVFPKGKKEIIKVTTSDGRIIECCEDHLWTITTSYGKKKTLTTMPNACTRCWKRPCLSETPPDPASDWRGQAVGKMQAEPGGHGTDDAGR
jgi:hypothetical protein